LASAIPYLVDFGFWILDFGLKTNTYMPVCGLLVMAFTRLSSIQNPKSKIENPIARQPSLFRSARQGRLAWALP